MICDLLMRRSVMPVHDIVVLSLIVSVFMSFGVLLGGVSWYCRGPRAHDARRGHSDSRREAYPTGAGLIIED
jgi:hypothetical protein